MKMFLVLQTGHSNSLGNQVIADGLAKLQASAVSVMCIPEAEDE